MISELWTAKPSLWRTKASFLNLFMKNLILGRVVPIIFCGCVLINPRNEMFKVGIFADVGKQQKNAAHYSCC